MKAENKKEIARIVSELVDHRFAIQNLKDDLESIDEDGDEIDEAINALGIIDEYFEDIMRAIDEEWED